MTHVSTHQECVPDFNRSQALAQMLQEHGPLLDARAIAKVLRFPSTTALDQSLRRGHLRLPLRSWPHRKGCYALTEDVYEFLRGLELKESSAE